MRTQNFPNILTGVFAPMPIEPEARRVRKLSPRALADEAGTAKETIEAIKNEAIRRGFRKVEGERWKLSLSPPGEANRTDKSRLLEVLGITESEFIARFCTQTTTDWVMRCTARKVLRTAEQPLVKSPAVAKRA